MSAVYFRFLRMDNSMIDFTFITFSLNGFYRSFGCFVCLFLLFFSCSKKSSDSSLVKAIVNGDTYAVHSMVERGMKINVEFERSRTPLMYAVMNGHANIAGYLIEKGANMEARDIYGDTALMYASVGGFGIVVDLLIEKGADVNVKNRVGNTPLFSAAKNGRGDIVKMLLKAEADPRGAGGDWKSALKDAEDLKDVRDMAQEQPGLTLKR